MQPHEFYKLVEGYNARTELADTKTAYFVSWLVNISGKSAKKNITTEEILKPFYPNRKPEVTQADKEYYADLFKRKR